MLASYPQPGTDLSYPNSSKGDYNEAHGYSHSRDRNGADDLYRSALQCSRQRACVRFGRGSHLILANQATLKIRVIGSPDVCAARIAERRGIDLTEARDTARQANEARERFLKHHFHHSLNDSKTYDVILNTDRFQGVPATVDLLEAAIKARQESEKA